jgi:hypothetical protein
VQPKDRQRLAVAHRVLDAVRTKSFRSETLATSAGDHVIVPALHDDTMGPLFDRLRETGEPIHVATLHGDNLAVLALVPDKPAKHAGKPTDPDEPFPISRDMAVGMVVDYLILRDRPIVLLEASPHISVALVENPEASPARKSSCTTRTT